MGWAGNVLLVVGLWLIGNKKRSAFVWSFFGETVWAVYAIHQRMYDLAFICIIFAFLAVRNWFKWGNDNPYWNSLVQDERRKRGKWFFES